MLSSVSSAFGGGINLEGGTNVFFDRDGSIRADSADSFEFDSLNSRVNVEEASGIEVRANGDFTIAAADYFRAGEIVFTNVENLQSQGSTLSFACSASATFGQSTSTNPRNFLANWQDTFTVESADIVVIGFNSLLMDFAESQGASVIVRGLRAVADFEYEYQMAGMNQQINARVVERVPISSHAQLLEYVAQNEAQDLEGTVVVQSIGHNFGWW